WAARHCPPPPTTPPRRTPRPRNRSSTPRSPRTPCSPCSPPNWPASAGASTSPWPTICATRRPPATRAWPSAPIGFPSTWATRDPGAAERAYRISEYLGATEAALDSARIWADSAPENVEARRAAAIQLARAGRFEESLAHMEAILRHKGNPHFDFLALSAAETDPETRAGLRDSFDQLLNRYPDNSQLLYGKALLLQQDGRPEEALALLDHPALTQQEIGALLLRARLLQSLDRGDEALPLLRKAIRQHPDDKRLRLAEARLLVDRRKLPEAHR